MGPPFFHCKTTFYSDQGRKKSAFVLFGGKPGRHAQNIRTNLYCPSVNGLLNEKQTTSPCISCWTATTIIELMTDTCCGILMVFDI